MNPKNPRIIFSVTPDQNKLIAEMARLTGTSKSGLFGELVDMLCPTWERMRVVLEAAERVKKGKGIDTLTDDLNHAQNAIEGVLGLLTSDNRIAEPDLLDFHGATVGRRTTRRPATDAKHDAAAAAAPTPPSNRGVINNQNQIKQQLSAGQKTGLSKPKKVKTDV